MKILIEKYGPYFLTQKTVAYDKYGLNYSIELVARSITSVTGKYNFLSESQRACYLSHLKFFPNLLIE